MTTRLSVRWGVKPPLLRQKEKILFRNPIIEQIDDLNRGLVAYYNDDGKSAATWLDMVNYPNGKNNGTIYGATTPPPATPQALGYLFDGVDDYIDCGNAASLNNPDKFTKTAFIKPKSFTNSAYPTIFNVGTFRLSLSLSPTGLLRSWINDANLVESNTQMSKENWYFVGLTWNGTNRTFYLNGIQDGVRSGVNYTGHTNVYIGSYIINSWFNGSIDEVRIFNRALSAGEINLLFQRYRGKFGI